MFKLLRYLKPFTWLIVLIFILLFGQAMTDLTLPDLMSKIVNIGIQQNGIENPTPIAIRASEMNKIILFMDDAGKSAVNRDYILLDKQKLSESEYNQYVKTYPGLANEPIYELTSAGEAEIDQLNAIFGPPIAAVATIEEAGTSALENIPGIPPGTDPFIALSQLPADQLTAILEAVMQQVSSMPENLINQSAISYLSLEYSAIGLNVSAMQTAYLLKIGGFMLLLTLAGAALSIAVGFLAARVAAGFARNTRKQLFNKVENFSNAEFDKFSTASLITRTTNDIQQIQLVLVMILRIAFYAPILGIGGILKALGQDASMSWIIGAAVAILITMIIVSFTLSIPKFKLMQKLVDKLNLVTREMLTGLMVVRAFNTQNHEEQKFAKANADLTKNNLFVNRIMIVMMPFMNLLMNGAMLLVVWFGAHQVNAGAMQVGSMMAFMQYTILIIMAFLMVSMVFIMIPQASVSAQRIGEVMDTDPTIIDPAKPQKFTQETKGYVQFDNVSFKYPGAEDYVLKNISFVAKPGQTTAIVGGTGSGKSTLINLIPRFYDVTEGKILVNNIDIRSVTQHDLRDKIGYAPQKTTLFSGTIESNIKYANESATDGDIEKVAEISQSLDFIKGNESGFKTVITQSGTNLSGGQKQRLAIARTLAKNPEIFIFDDSFSALDYRTDAALRKALKKETTNSTVLIVGQRISTIMNADQIIVLDNGRIVDTGTHKELMEKCEVYQELALSQLSKEELVQ
jgi:ATP-binding cassette, subfamily B, multidrug efflux pump